MHMQRNLVSGVLCGLIFTLLLTGCSGGGDDATSTPPPVATSAEGLWTGTSDDGHTIAGVVLDDGTYWFLYFAAGNPSLVAGAFQGTGSGYNGAFSSSDGRDFNFEFASIFDVTVSARVVARRSFNGTLDYLLGGRSTFTSTFNADYDGIPEVGLVVGTYTGSILGISYTMMVSPSGAITLTNMQPGSSAGSSAGISVGCDFAGALFPRVHGNVYDISFTSVPVPGLQGCTRPTLTGIAYFDAATNKVYILALNSNRSGVFPFVGTKP